MTKVITKEYTYESSYAGRSHILKVNAKTKSSADNVLIGITRFPADWELIYVTEKHFEVGDTIKQVKEELINIAGVL